MVTPSTVPVLDQSKARNDVIALTELVSAPYNERKITATDPRVISMADSMKSFGQLQEILVRPVGGKFEIMCGHRRYAAAKLAGLPSLRCRVVAEADDQVAKLVNAIENIQREDLKPLEEAASVKSLLEMGYDIDAIIAHTGRTESWLRLRARLTALTPAWRKACDDHGSRASMLTAGHLDMIARLSAGDQDELLADIDGWELRRSLFHEDSGMPVPVTKFGQVIATGFLRDLSKAVWPVDDATLVKSAGACTSCTKRTSCQGNLFPDLASVKGDRCLDGKCWVMKRDAFVVRREDELKTKNPDIIKVDLDARRAGDVVKGAIGGSQVIEMAKKGEKGAVQALVAAGPRAGETVYVKPGYYAKENAAARKAFDLPSPQQLAAKAKERQAKSSKPKAKELPIADRRHRFIASELREKISKVARPDDARLLRLVVALGYEPDVYGGWSTAKDWQKINIKRTWEQDCHTLWKSITDLIEGDLEGASQGASYAEIDAEAMAHIAELVGADHKALVAAAAAKFPDLKEGITAAKTPVPTGKSASGAKPKAAAKKSAKPKAKKGKA